jgi:hypothetical protein
MNPAKLSLVPRSGLILLIVTFSAGVIFGQGAGSLITSGKWESPQWNLDTLVLDLKVSGEKLTGTLQSVEIYDGKIEKNLIQFKVKSPDGMRVITFSGPIGGNQLRLTRKVETLQAGSAAGGNDIFGTSGPASIVLTRVPQPPSRKSSHIDK